MGLMDAQDKLGEAIQAKRIMKKASEEAASKVAEDAAKQAQQHEENKEQGMI